MSHTPGPWAVHPSFPLHVVPLADAAKHIGGSVDPDDEARDYAKVIHRGDRESQYPQFHRSRIVSRDEVKANARLIAAAPDLLAACKKTIEENLELADGDNCTLIDLKRAIAKAEGQ